ncbi:antitoxin Xre/MbcA/ParS toxin-binding domain-containing protein [Azospirillum sp. B506]|uniref:antitoxin Xre/MbcA/ParS toxin-binding domain-containing protein n=1 Tax=Azospirillum sp. B506 TaxID=137721 RepID=UPI0003499556|nr:antitoxin Xre/MbcA/ParS toxin-binding domain-containing protein [Azospirillum sp. B506]
MVGFNAVVNGDMVFDRAVEVLGTAERAAEWMGCKDSQLGVKPDELVKTDDGMAQVLHCLRRIELGQPV